MPHPARALLSAGGRGSTLERRADDELVINTQDALGKVVRIPPAGDWLSQVRRITLCRDQVRSHGDRSTPLAPLNVREFDLALPCPLECAP